MAVIAAASRTIIDLFDPIQQGTEPLPPVMDMLWLDTSLDPNQIKRWDGTAWTVVNDTSTLDSRITAAELLITDDAIVATVRSSLEYGNDLDSRVLTADYEAQVSLIEGAIALKTSQGTTNDLENRLLIAEEKIMPDAIVSSVRSHDDYKIDRENILSEIGTVQTALNDKIEAAAIANMATIPYVQEVNSTEIAQRNNAIELSVTAEKTRAESVEGEIKTFTDRARTYFAFLLDGLEIGKEGSPFKTLLGDQKLSFTQGGVEVAYIQYNRLYISIAEVMDVLTIGQGDDPANGITGTGFTDIKTSKYSTGGGISAIWRAN